MQNAPSITESNLTNNDPLATPVVKELMGTIKNLQHENEQLKHRLDLLLKRIYGPRADKIDPNQKLMFEEQTPEPVPAPSEPEPEYKLVKPLKKGHGRKFLPENLRRETVVVDVTAAEKSVIGGTWVHIGEEVTEKLDYTPSSLFVRRTVRPKYVVRFAKLPERMVVADLPPEALPKCKAAPGLVADVIVSKMVDHMPLYRQEKRHSRQGVELSRSTMCGWLQDAAFALEPLYRILKQRVLAENVVHTDDTPIPVQDDAREHCRTGRLWVYVSRGGTVHDSTPDRSRDGPQEFLKGFRGYLQCDAYPGYNRLFEEGTVVEVGCWAHARRKFIEAEKTCIGPAHEAVARIRALYAIEHEGKELDTSARFALRQSKAVPCLQELKSWLEKQRVEVLPKSPMAEAINYSLNQWEALKIYTCDGNLAIDNNIAERAIKPFAIGRKNWLFFGSDQGGKSLAILSSFTATCQQFGINPWTYLRDTLTKLPTTLADQLHTLLPTK
mgnify:CR=1 FL=1